MQTKLLDFARRIGFSLDEKQAQLLAAYASLVWQKKALINLTSAANLEEIILRHICDGLQGACCILNLAKQQHLDHFSIIDAGAGAGYIGLTLAMALPQAQVTLVESIEKRCAFMNWAILSLGLKNATVKKMRLGETKNIEADFVTERAMGQLPDILGVCLSAVKPGGVFMAYQGEHPQTRQVSAPKDNALFLREEPYLLPIDDKKRFLVLFTRVEK